MSHANRPGFTIKMFLPDGTPDGLSVVEKSNWTGRAIVCPRSKFVDAKARAELKRTGVYLLHGPTSSGDFPTVYVGEGDPVRQRLDEHYAKKDFWTKFVLFTSKDENLNKAHVQYLESRLVGIARERKRCKLDNGNTPQLPSLSESDVAEMEVFLGEMLLIYPILGIDIFEAPLAAPPPAQILFLKAKDTAAEGYEAPQGFVVRAQSRARKSTVPSIHNYLMNLRAVLLSQDILRDGGDHYELTQDYAFDSASSAAGVMLGRSANGRIEWKDRGGRTLKQIQEAAILNPGVMPG